MKKTLSLTAAALCTLLSSCYFNSAGHLFAKGNYPAYADISDAKVGQYVYSNAGNYYVELPRFKKARKVRTQYTAWEKNTRKEIVQATGEVSLFRIPEEFAMYLTGQASAPTTPAYMTPVGGAENIKSGATKMPITRTAGSYVQNFSYTTPNAAWWYTAGVFDWLCVDLPITITENALAISVGVIAILAEDAKKNSND